MSELAKKIEPQVPSLDRLVISFDQFAKAAIDAYVIVNGEGQVMRANQLFSHLTGVKIKKATRAASLDEIITFNLNGVPLPIEKILAFDQPQRMDEVRATTHSNDHINLIMAVYPLDDDQLGGRIGTLILLRDVTAETDLQSKYKDTHQESITDELSGLFTRRYFDGYLKLYSKTMEMEGEQEDGSSGTSLCFIIIDIDHFKKVNDTYGHLVGDKVISRVGKILKQSCRKSDIVCRYGGEEFLIILQNTTYHQACFVAENLRKKIAEKPVDTETEGQQVHVTASTGISQMVRGENYTVALKRADDALYESKNAGRNRTHYHDGDDIRQFVAPKG